MHYRSYNCRIVQDLRRLLEGFRCQLFSLFLIKHQFFLFYFIFAFLNSNLPLWMIMCSSPESFLQMRWRRMPSARCFLLLRVQGAILRGNSAFTFFEVFCSIEIISLPSRYIYIRIYKCKSKLCLVPRCKELLVFTFTRVFAFMYHLILW